MEVLASCSYEESLKFDGKLQIPTDGVSKPDRVSLNVVVEDGDISILSKLPVNVKCVTYKGNADLSGISDKRVFREVPLSEIGNADLSGNVTTLVRVDESFSDMRKAREICSMGDNVRIIGGYLLQIDGVRIGRYDLGKNGGTIVYSGIYDSFVELPLLEIGNLQEVVRKARTKLDSGGDEGKKKNVKSERKAIRKTDFGKSFNTLFEGEEEDF